MFTILSTTYMLRETNLIYSLHNMNRQTTINCVRLFCVSLLFTLVGTGLGGDGGATFWLLTGPEGAARVQ